MGRRGPKPIPDGELSPREIEVLQFYANGFSYKDIARELVLSRRTVINHTANIRTRLAVKKTVSAMRIAFEKGWIV